MVSGNRRLLRHRHRCLAISGQRCRAYDSVRDSTFNVISIITGTGYSTADYYLWGSFAVTCFFLFMFISGCAGSTSCGIKIFRFQILVTAVRGQMKKIWQPHGVFVPYYNRRPLPDSVVDAVMNFVFVFVLVFVLLALSLSALGLDFVTSVSGAATALSNVGPALGDIIGPTGTFMPLPDAAKWLLSLGMLLGRLELFTVLVLFGRRFGVPDPIGPIEMIGKLVAFDTTSAHSNLSLIDFVAGYLNGHGIACETIPDPTGTKANLVATFGGDRTVGGGVVLSGHTDVVPVTGQTWTTDPFAAVEKNGRLYGRGTADMKSFIGVALALVPEFLAQPLATPVQLALSYDEEVGCLGAPAW